MLKKHNQLCKNTDLSPVTAFQEEESRPLCTNILGLYSITVFLYFPYYAEDTEFDVNLLCGVVI